MIDFYFKRAGLPQTEEITREFQRILPILYPSFQIDSATGFFKSGITNSEVKDLMPTLSQVMHDIGLYDSWQVTSFVSASSASPIRPHIDAPPSANSPGRIFALNYPIFNCETSVTSFFKDPQIKGNVLNVQGSKASYVDFSQEKLELETAMILTEPTWIRVDVPHSVTVQPDSKPRLAATLRFNPEPFNYLNVNI